MNDERPDLEIRTACPKSWDELEGQGGKRFCSECALHVHSSTALTRGEAHALVEEADARVCMRIVRDPSGAPVYARGRLARLAHWALAAGASLVAACQKDAGPARTEERPDAPAPEAAMGIVFPEELGDVVCPAPEGPDTSAHPQTSETGDPAGASGGTVELLGEVCAPEPPGGAGAEHTGS